VLNYHHLVHSLYYSLKLIFVFVGHAGQSDNSGSFCGCRFFGLQRKIARYCF